MPVKIGLFSALYGHLPLQEVLAKMAAQGLQAIEIGVGAYPGQSHINPDELLASADARDRFLGQVRDHGLSISALSVHGNPIHPNKEIAQAHHDAFIRGVKLASALGIPVVNGFSGCPGDHPGAVNPNWVTCAWPDEYRDILEWQWNEVVIPYWTAQSHFLNEHNVNFAIEMHPGFVVYNNETLLRLRNSTGEHGHRIGANFDPSHLWWQGIDPLLAVRELGEAGAIFHVHAKDTLIDPHNSGRNGNLDTKSYGDHLGRSWAFRSVGYGHDAKWWNDFVSMLRKVGYDYVLSIEHEDGLMTSDEGLAKAVALLKQVVIQDPAGPMFWARD